MLADKASLSMEAAPSVMFTALSTRRAVGSRTSMSTSARPASVRLLEVRLELDGVMDRNDGLRQPARRSGEGVSRLGKSRIGGAEQAGDQHRGDQARKPVHDGQCLRQRSRRSSGPWLRGHYCSRERLRRGGGDARERSRRSSEACWAHPRPPPRRARVRVGPHLIHPGDRGLRRAVGGRIADPSRARGETALCRAQCWRSV